MHILNTEHVLERLPFNRLIPQMRELFAAGVTCPDRHHHTITHANQTDGTLLLMSGWHDNIGCVKVANVTPDNGTRNLPAISASVLAFNRETGEHLAIMDGDAITARRTAAAGALAASLLAPKHAAHLLVLGSGKVAAQLPDAFASVRPIERVSIWNRSRAGAERLAANLQDRPYDVQVVTDRLSVIADADIISAATLATEPLIFGEALRSGQHVDLIGSFKPTMREADDAVITRAKGAIFVDAPFTAEESGDLSIPLARGVITASDIAGDLTALCRGHTAKADITLFKGAGNAVMDLAAVMTVMKSIDADKN